MDTEYNTVQKNLRCGKHKGVAPIIATLLMVAIAVVGGILIFVFAQGFFNQTQVNSTPQIESLAIIGYDARTGITNPNDAEGNPIAGADAGASAASLATKDNVIIYVKNSSIKASILSTVQFGGVTYALDTASNVIPSAATPIPVANKYCLTDPVTQKCTAVASATIQPGGVYTIALNLPAGIKAGRDLGVILTTSLNNVFQGTVVIGQNQG